MLKKLKAIGISFLITVGPPRYIGRKLFNGRSYICLSSRWTDFYAMVNICTFPVYSHGDSCIFCNIYGASLYGRHIF